MSEPEQCIICLDPLPRPSPTALLGDAEGESEGDATTSDHVPKPSSPVPAIVPAVATDGDSSYLDVVAALDGCEHIIHDACIRSWAQKTNTCPICRNVFHTVKVYNGVDGTAISTYDVQDKKQVAEFDVQQWLGDNPEEEEEESNPCPICNTADHEDVLLLCDSCDAAYHTHCVGLEDIPEGDWYCMECSHLFRLNEPPRPTTTRASAPRAPQARRPTPRSLHVRTRARVRRARRQARNVEWQGAWGQFSGRFYEMSELDLDNHDGEDEDMEQYRRFQQLDRRELQRWQQRMNIANRLGARDTFVNNIPPEISERLQPQPVPQLAPIPETRDERRAWGAFERARDVEDPAPTTRKRKTRSVTASPAEPLQEPERKLKRPRTRRLPTNQVQAEASGSASSPPLPGSAPSLATNGGMSSTPSIAPGPTSPAAVGDQVPPLVSSLLKELEPLAPLDENGGTGSNGVPMPPASSPAGSPAASPTASAYSSPRALSLTPPPLPWANGRPSSPTLSLSTHIEPRYPPANYSPTRHNSDNSDSDSRPSKTERRRAERRSLELRQPQPQRAHQVAHSEDRSLSRLPLTQEEKKSINDFVKGALRPHWHSQKLTTEQYATINRDISRKLYDEIKDASTLNGVSRRTWENRASQAVAQAVAQLQA